ncbi:AtaL-like protein [Polyangium jinanense]|uniref:DUF1857 family protein n=1 Tax=Polyangium jinanense TaxID=2829994 RepID=A0A9X3XJZ4_9BACT|nr:AtaL-like protein [Polyangium jinanense]MDC3989466.1 DUF1857 family protein [Polyangium jinanense]MDC3989561.1 DUF1857 family protein [Polyangium jinanense]
MKKLGYEVTVNEPGALPLSRAEVWRGLEMKAENALPFVPGMTRCDVLEKGDGWLLREIEFGGQPIRERVTFEPETRVHFERVAGAPGWVDNVIDEQPDGSLVLRFVFGVPDEDEAKARELEPVYRKAVAATLATVRRMVSEGTIPRR